VVQAPVQNDVVCGNAISRLIRLHHLSHAAFIVTKHAEHAATHNGLPRIALILEAIE